MARLGQPPASAADWAALAAYRAEINNATRFIPTWVRVAGAPRSATGAQIEAAWSTRDTTVAISAVR
jgi:hypothetical protein